MALGEDLVPMEFPPLAELNEYDDMDGLGAFITPEMLKEHAIAGVAGAGAILLGSAIVQRIPYPTTMDPMTVKRLKGLAGIVLGVLGGRALYFTNAPAAFGVVGGLAGAAMAQLVGDMAGMSTSLSGLGDRGTNAYQNYYQLQQAGVEIESPTGPVQISGFDGTVVTNEGPALPVGDEYGLPMNGIGSWLAAG